MRRTGNLTHHLHSHRSIRNECEVHRCIAAFEVLNLSRQLCFLPFKRLGKHRENRVLRYGAQEQRSVIAEGQENCCFLGFHNRFGRGRKQSYPPLSLLQLRASTNPGGPPPRPLRCDAVCIAGYIPYVGGYRFDGSGKENTAISVTSLDGFFDQ